MKKTFGARMLLLTSLVSVPMFVHAQAQVTSGITSFADIINAITGSLINALISLFASAALAAFFYGIVQYIWGMRAGDATKISNGNKFMAYGVLALFVMFSIWGIIRLGQTMFGIQNNTSIIVPQFEIGNRGSTNTGNNNSLPVGSSEQCTAVGNSCQTSSGQAGTCRAGTAANDFATRCLPN